MTRLPTLSARNVYATIRLSRCCETTPWSDYSVIHCSISSVRATCVRHIAAAWTATVSSGILKTNDASWGSCGGPPSLARGCSQEKYSKSWRFRH